VPSWRRSTAKVAFEPLRAEPRPAAMMIGIPAAMLVGTLAVVAWLWWRQAPSRWRAPTAPVRAPTREYRGPAPGLRG